LTQNEAPKADNRRDAIGRPISQKQPGAPVSPALRT